MKKKLENLFKGGFNNDGTMQEQIDILKKLLISKEDDLRTKDSQYILMTELWKEKETKLKMILVEREKDLTMMERRLIELENELLSKERTQTELEREIAMLSNGMELYKSKEELWTKRSEELRTQSNITEEKLKDRTKENRRLEKKIDALENEIIKLNNELELERKRYSSIVTTSPSTSPSELSSTLSDELIFILSKISHFLFSDRLFELIEDSSSSSTSSSTSISNELKQKLMETETKMRGKYQQNDSITNKIHTLEELLVVKEKIIAEYRKRLDQSSSLPSSPSSSFSSSTIFRKQIRNLEIQLKEQRNENDTKDTEMKRLKNQLHDTEERLKHKILNSKIELDIQMEDQMFNKKELFLEFKNKMNEKKRKIKSLEVETQKIAESIIESEAMVTTYSDILKEKTEALRAKEELAYHFFDLIKQSDEHIKLQDEQVAKMYFNLGKQDSLTTTIIDDYNN